MAFKLIHTYIYIYIYIYIFIQNDNRECLRLWLTQSFPGVGTLGLMHTYIDICICIYVSNNNIMKQNK